MKSVRDVLNEMRKKRSVEMEIAIQDFLELTPAEQLEILFDGSVHAAHNADWCVKVLSERAK